MSAIAATGSFPYNHRTVAEMDDEAVWLGLLARKPINRGGNGADWIDRTVGVSFDYARASATQAPRASLPDFPCPNCGARGWCGHGDRIAA